MTRTGGDIFGLISAEGHTGDEKSRMRKCRTVKSLCECRNPRSIREWQFDHYRWKKLASHGHHRRIERYRYRIWYRKCSRHPLRKSSLRITPPLIWITPRIITPPLILMTGKCANSSQRSPIRTPIFTLSDRDIYGTSSRYDRYRERNIPLYPPHSRSLEHIHTRGTPLCP